MLEAHAAALLAGAAAAFLAGAAVAEVEAVVAMDAEAGQDEVQHLLAAEAPVATHPGGGNTSWLSTANLCCSDDASIGISDGTALVIVNI